MKKPQNPRSGKKTRSREKTLGMATLPGNGWKQPQTLSINRASRCWENGRRLVANQSRVVIKCRQAEIELNSQY